jgi:hypothetical protein
VQKLDTIRLEPALAAKSSQRVSLLVRCLIAWLLTLPSSRRLFSAGTRSDATHVYANDNVPALDDDHNGMPLSPR